MTDVITEMEQQIPILTPKKRGRPKSKKKLYFGPEVQDAIVRYNEDPDNHNYNDIQSKNAFIKTRENIFNLLKKFIILENINNS